MPSQPISSTLLAKSAQGATFLIALQIVSRALTFLVNQLLLRYLSPQLLGLSTQLDLYGNTVLYFARESLRVAIQRVGDGGDEQPSVEEEDEKALKNGTLNSEAEGGSVRDSTEAISPDWTRKLSSVRAGASRTKARPSDRSTQAAINASYASILLGPLLASFFATLYLRSAGRDVLSTPFLRPALALYVHATILELAAEPAFTLAQRQMLFGLRARAEAAGALLRCVVTCGVAIVGSRKGWDLGALPFAIGQMGFAAAVIGTYYWSLRGRDGEKVSLLPWRIGKGDNKNYFFDLLPRQTISLTLSLTFQSAFKHLLTQGDALLTTAFTTLSEQGTYALASAYGSLLARILFQPIEESSRSLFGRLLSPTSPQVSSSSISSAAAPSRQSLLAARSYMYTLLRSYALLSLIILTLGPVISPLLLRLVAGPTWSATCAPKVLATYCYYVPMLAFNGILEAFVASVASPSVLRAQAAVMLLFSAAYAGAGVLLLKMWDRGAVGLVWANGIAMAARVGFSTSFVRGWFDGQGLRVELEGFAPRWTTVAWSFGVKVVLEALKMGFDGSLWDLGKTIATGGFYGLVFLWLELDFLVELYRTIRPTEAGKRMEEKDAAEKKQRPAGPQVKEKNEDR